MKEKTILFFNKVVMIALLLSPILQTYGWGKYNFASLLTLGLALIHFSVKAKRTKMPKYIGTFLLYWLFSHVIANDFPQSLFPFGIIRIALIYMMFYDCFNLNYFVKKYRLLTLILIGFFYIQTFSRFVAGKVIPSVFSFLSLSITNDATGFFSQLQVETRDSSFFSEPAIFVQFLLPILALELLYFEKKSWFRIGSIVLTLLLLQSGNALLGMLVVGMFYILSFYRGKFTFKKIIGLSLISIIIIVGSSIYIKSDMGESLMERGNTVSIGAYDEGYVGSGFIRVYRGYFIYNDYSFLNKVFGNDNEDYIKAVIKRSPWGWTFRNETYFNTFQSFLIYTGIIGTLLFGVFYVRQWKQTNYCGKSILACYLALSFIALMHFNAMMAIFLLIPYALKNNTTIVLGKQVNASLENSSTVV